MSGPLVPVTTRVNEPIEAEELALTIRVEFATDADAGVTGPGRLTEIPEGARPIQEKLRPTVELNSLFEITLMVDVPFEP